MKEQANHAAASDLIGTLTDPECPRITTAALQEEVKSAVTRAAIPAPSAELLSALENRAVSAIEGAAALPFNPAVWTDRLAQQEVERLGAERSACEAALQRATAQVSVLRNAHGDLPLPHSTIKRLAVRVALLATCVLGALALSLLMLPSVDHYLWRQYMVKLLGGGQAALWSAGMALLSCFVISCFLLLPQALSIMLATERHLVVLKIMSFSAELLFSLMLTLVRSEKTFAFQSLSMSGLEFALIVIQSVLFFAVGPWLAKDTESAAAYRRSTFRLALFEQARAEAEAALARCEHKYASYVRTLEIRIDAARRNPCNKELVRSSVAAEYLIATAELVAKENERALAEGETLEHFVDEHLATERREGMKTTSPRGPHEDL